MKIAYFDCFSGAAGDMILGALLDAGLGLDVLTADLDKLGLNHFRVGVEPAVKGGISASRALVEIDQAHHEHHHRGLGDILDIIAKSGLEPEIRENSAKVFQRLARAEAKVHRVPVESVHFHEVGAMDAIIDVVGSVAGLARLGVEAVHCSPLNTGFGTVRCAHGLLPVPAPATAELVRGFPVYSQNDEPGELLTPTGAAILTTLSQRFGPMGKMTIQDIGYGAGYADRSMPNLLRVIVGNGEND